MRNTADVTGGKHMAVLLQSIPGVSAFNRLVAFHDTHGGKKEVLFFYFVPDNPSEGRNITFLLQVYVSILVTSRFYYKFLV
jgi:hypothetical protein